MLGRTASSNPNRLTDPLGAAEAPFDGCPELPPLEQARPTRLIATSRLSIVAVRRAFTFFIRFPPPVEWSV